MRLELVAIGPRLRNGVAAAGPRVASKLQCPSRWNNVVSHLSALVGALLDLGRGPDSVWAWASPAGEVFQ
eukprot:4124341-Pyramimonas_sp.AAC.1